MDCGDFKSHFRLKRETVEHVLSLIVNQLQSQALENRLTEVDPLKAVIDYFMDICYPRELSLD
jgi:hypothetical protein